MSTRLGYGCSSLMGGITRRESITLLRTAYDCGIRHFDTAPSYGYGHAERVLGDALRSNRDRVTITTKFGIRPPRHQSLLGAARRVLRPLIKHAPSVKSRLSRAAGGLAGRARFSPDELRMSLEASLVALGTDYIDILLLHEAVVADLSDELFALLERIVREGKIASFGIGSKRVAAEQIHRAERRFCSVMQFEWSVLSCEQPTYPGSVVITHRSLSENFARLRGWLSANPTVARVWAEELDMDVANSSVLSHLMVAAARHANPDGITLFSSRSPQNIRANAQLLSDDTDLRAAGTFATLVARDAAEVVGIPQDSLRLDVGAPAGQSADRTTTLIS
ncbi:MAG: aldo/keto reductase [Stellaceae bacterium]